MFEGCLTEYGGLEPTEWLAQERIAECGGFDCCECKAEIFEGERYFFVVANYEGDWLVYATCEPCNRIRVSLFKGDYVFGSLWKRIGEVYGLTTDGVVPIWEGEQNGVELSEHYAEQLEQLGAADRKGPADK